MINDNCYFDKNGEKKIYSPDAVNYARERVSYELSYTYGMGFTDEQRDWIADHIFVSVRKTYQNVLDKQVEYKGTDLELANKYFDEECLHSYADNEEQLKEDVVSAFLKGLKTGREEVTKGNEKI